jgi:hypothetical protein
MLDVGKNAAKLLNFRTYQFGMKWETWNLQGGGRWFKSSIAHLGNSCKRRHGTEFTTWFPPPLPSPRLRSPACPTEHGTGHAQAGDFPRWGRRGGLRTLALYGPGWFALLARRRWEEITAEQLAEVFALLRKAALSAPLYSFGRVVATPAALALLAGAGENPADGALARTCLLHGCWGLRRRSTSHVLAQGMFALNVRTMHVNLRRYAAP